MTIAFVDLSALLGDPLRAGIGPQSAAVALAALALNLHWGWQRRLDLGMAGFMAAGAYGAAITVTQGWFGGSIVAGIVIGLTAAVALAVLIGLCSLGLPDVYVAVVSLAAAETLRRTVASDEARGLTGGLVGLPTAADRSIGVSLSRRIGQDWNPLVRTEDPTRTYGFWRLEFEPETMWLVLVGWALVIVGTLAIWRIVRSRALVGAPCPDPVASPTPGRPGGSEQPPRAVPWRHTGEPWVWVLGGAIGSVAGIVSMLDHGTVEPSRFGPEATMLVWAALVCGGVASKWGPAVGAITASSILYLVEDAVRRAADAGWLPDALVGTSEVATIRPLVIGALLVAVVAWRPQGLLGSAQWSRRRSPTANDAA